MPNGPVVQLDPTRSHIGEQAVEAFEVDPEHTAGEPHAFDGDPILSSVVDKADPIHRFGSRDGLGLGEECLRLLGVGAFGRDTRPPQKGRKVRSEGYVIEDVLGQYGMSWMGSEMSGPAQASIARIAGRYKQTNLRDISPQSGSML